MIVDTHCHAWRAGGPFAAGAAYAPDGPAPFERLAAAWRAHGIGGGVLVQPSFLGADNGELLGLLAAKPAPLRAVIVADPSRDAPRAPELTAAGVRGVRFNLISGGPLPDVEAPAWTRLFAAAADAGWHVVVAAPAPELVRALPRLEGRGLPVVIDHFGLPAPARGAACPAWRASLADGAARGLYVKLSAPFRLGGVAVESLWPTLLGEVGADRLLWGSDWPWTRHAEGRSFAEALGAPFAGAPFGLAATAAANARRLYGF